VSKIDRVIKALHNNPKWKTKTLAKHVGCGEKIIFKARALLGIRNPDRQDREWTEAQDNCLLDLRDNDQMSFKRIGIDMGIAASSIRKRYNQLQGGTGEDTGRKAKVKSDFIWKPGPLVPYVPVFGR